MIFNSTIQKLKRIAKIPSANDGVALVEFGLLFPILFILLTGGLEVSRYILFHQKIDNAASHVADIITQMNVDVVPCTGGAGSLDDMFNTVLAGAVRPYDATQDGQMIVSAVEATHPNPNSPNNNIPMTQTVTWQWSSGGDNFSRVGNDGGPANGAGWPQVFRDAPSGNPGGLNDGDRVIAVEVFFRYSMLLPGAEVLVPAEDFTNIYKFAFYRARFSNLSSLGCNQ